MEVTETERRVIEGLKSLMPEIPIEMHMELVRRDMKRTAHHEAGHTVANSFFGFKGSSNFERISIIPGNNRSGYLSLSRVVPFKVVGAKPCKYEQVNGRIRMITLLAGRVAASRVQGRRICHL